MSSNKAGILTGFFFSPCVVAVASQILSFDFSSLQPPILNSSGKIFASLMFVVGYFFLLFFFFNAYLDLDSKYVAQLLPLPPGTRSVEIPLNSIKKIPDMKGGALSSYFLTAHKTYKSKDTSAA